MDLYWFKASLKLEININKNTTVQILLKLREKKSSLSLIFNNYSFILFSFSDHRYLL